MRLHSLSRIFAVAALVAIPTSAHAQFTTYTDFASFVAATSGAGIDTFSNLTDGPVDSPTTRTAGSFSYQVGSPLGLFAGGANRAISTSDAPVALVFSGFGAGVRGIGGNFFATDLNLELRPTSTLSITVTHGGAPFTQTLTNPGLGSFFGIVSDNPITSFSVQAVQPVGTTVDFAYATADNLTLAGARASNVVPEPSTFLLMGAGIVGVVVLRRRRIV